MSEQPPWFTTLVLGAIIGVIVSIPFNLAINLMTPSVQKIFARRALSFKGKKLDRLEKDYNRIKEFHEKPSTLYLTLANIFMFAIGFLIFIVGIFSLLESFSDSFLGFGLITKIIYFLVGLSAFVFSNLLLRFSDDLTRLREFDQYESTMKTEIKKIKETQNIQ